MLLMAAMSWFSWTDPLTLGDINLENYMAVGSVQHTKVRHLGAGVPRDSPLACPLNSEGHP